MVNTLIFGIRRCVHRNAFKKRPSCLTPWKRLVVMCGPATILRTISEGVQLIRHQYGPLNRAVSVQAEDVILNWDCTAWKSFLIHCVRSIECWIHNAYSAVVCTYSALWWHEGDLRIVDFNPYVKLLQIVVFLRFWLLLFSDLQNIEHDEAGHFKIIANGVLVTMVTYASCVFTTSKTVSSVKE